MCEKSVNESLVEMKIKSLHPAHQTRFQPGDDGCVHDHDGGGVLRKLKSLHGRHAYDGHAVWHDEASLH